MAANQFSKSTTPIWISFSLLVMAPLAVATVAVFSLISKERMDSRIREPLLVRLAEAKRVHLLARDQSIFVRGYFLTGERWMLHQAQIQGDSLIDAASGFLAETFPEVERAAAVRIIESEQEYRAWMDRQGPFDSITGLTPEFLAHFRENLEPRRLALENAVAALTELQRQNVEAAERSMDRYADFWTRAVVGVAMACILLALALAASLGRRLARSVKVQEQSQRRLQSVVQSAMDAIITIDASQRILLFNKAAEKIFRLPADKAMGEPIDRLIPARYRKRHEQHIDSFGKTGITARTMGLLGTLYGLRADGEEFPLEATISQAEDNGDKLYTVILRDITDRRRAEEILEYQSRLTNTIMDNASVALFLLDENERTTYANQAAQNLTGYSLNELRDLSLHEGIHSKAKEEEGGHETCELRNALGERRSLKNHEDELIRKNGVKIPILCALEPVIQNDRVVGMVLEIVDLSERKKTEQALHDSEERLRQSQKMEAIGNLAGGIAHDFNNLLTAINGYSELAETQATGQPELQESLKEIRHAGQRAAELTRQLLAYSRRQMIMPKVLNLNQLVSNFSRLLVRLIGENIELTLDLDPDLNLTHLDASQVEQVILNLTLNARDAMPAGGRLILRTRNVSQLPKESLALEGPPGNYVELSVQDSGSGISAQIMGKIFEPFFTTKGVGKGTGLGLASVYGIVNQAQGAIAVESSLQSGTLFRIFFPATLRKEWFPASNNQEESTPFKAKGETIFLVEDEKSVRGFIHRILVNVGFKVVEAASGIEARDRILADKLMPDLLLTDVVMPGMSGRELAHSLLAINPKLKVLFMSGYTDELLTGQDNPPDSDNFLPKPFSPAQLLEKISLIQSLPASKSFP